MNRSEIAKVCHEVNRAYCQAIGDNSQVEWNDAPQWQKDSAMAGVNLHCDKNVGVEASHENWVAEKILNGWVYGEAKDADAKTHPCIVPFAELPTEQKAKDFIFRSVVHALRETSE
jgi:RyR domain